MTNSDHHKTNSAHGNGKAAAKALPSAAAAAAGAAAGKWAVGTGFGGPGGSWLWTGLHCHYQTHDQLGAASVAAAQARQASLWEYLHYRLWIALFVIVIMADR